MIQDVLSVEGTSVKMKSMHNGIQITDKDLLFIINNNLMNQLYHYLITTLDLDMMTLIYHMSTAWVYNKFIGEKNILILTKIIMPVIWNRSMKARRKLWTRTHRRMRKKNAKKKFRKERKKTNNIRISNGLKSTKILLNNSEIRNLAC